MNETELVKYRVYYKKNNYHHSYLKLEDAKNCAERISGSVKTLTGKKI